MNNIDDDDNNNNNNNKIMHNGDVKQTVTFI
jgi:hypothetical protein